MLRKHCASLWPHRGARGANPGAASGWSGRGNRRPGGAGGCPDYILRADAKSLRATPRTPSGRREWRETRKLVKLQSLLSVTSDRAVRRPARMRVRGPQRARAAQRLAKAGANHEASGRPRNHTRREHTRKGGQAAARRPQDPVVRARAQGQNAIRRAEPRTGAGAQRGRARLRDPHPPPAAAIPAAPRRQGRAGPRPQGTGKTPPSCSPRSTGCAARKACARWSSAPPASSPSSGRERARLRAQHGAVRGRGVRGVPLDKELRDLRAGVDILSRRRGA